jgi:hypothetical protein
MQKRAQSNNFEDVYPLYEFAPLVRLGLAIAGWIIAALGRRSSRTHQAEI